MEKRTCCYVGEEGSCEALAEFEIYGVGKGLDPYSNVTETCEKHVGALLGIPVDEHKRGLRPDHWRVWPIGGFSAPQRRKKMSLRSKAKEAALEALRKNDYVWLADELDGGREWDGVAGVALQAALSVCDEHTELARRAVKAWKRGFSYAEPFPHAMDALAEAVDE